MTDLTKSQRAAIYPGPGSSEYARGSPSTMRALVRKGLVKGFGPFSTFGQRGGLLTDAGKAVRAELAKEASA